MSNQGFESLSLRQLIFKELDSHCALIVPKIRNRYDYPKTQSPNYPSGSS